MITIKDYSNVTTIKLSPDGKVYAGGYNEFGYLERNESGQFEYHSLKNLLDSTIQMNEIWQIIFLNNQVYFQSYEHIIRFDGEKTHALPINNAYLLPINNQMYLSTYDSGIAKVIEDSIYYIDGLLDLDNDAAFKLLPGPEEKQLVLTETNGLFLLDTTNLSFEKWDVKVNHILQKEGLYDAIVWNDSTYLFATSKNGIIWVNSEGEPLREIRKDHGLSSNYMRELLRDSKGNLWLPNDGIDYLTWHNQPKVKNFNTLLRYIEVNDSSIYINTSSGQQLIDKNVNSIVFHFATPGYDRTDLEYSYYLEGFEEEWSSWKSDVKKEYTNLESRDYNFHVKARLKNGEVSTVASVQFAVPVLWYQSFWTYFLGVILIAGVTSVIVRLRMVHLKSLNKRLEKVINDRTKKLREQKEELSKTNTELVLANDELDNFVYRSSHDLVAPLKSLKGLIQITNIEKSENERQKYFDMMNTSIVKLEDFIKSILDYSTNSNGDFEQEEINLDAMLDSIVEDLQYFDSAQKVTMKRHFDKQIKFVSDPKRVKIILSNLIANAVKYHNYNQDNPIVDVVASKSGGSFLIDIIDNGQGIKAIYLDKIFNMFYRASEKSEGSGLGLYIVKDTVDKLNGQIKVTSELGKGTKFSLKFNLN